MKKILTSVNFNNNKAFTLMELMIVIVIIGILSAVGMVMFGGQSEKAKIAATKANHKQVVKYAAVELTRCLLGEQYIMVDQFSNRLECTRIKIPGSTSQAITRALIEFKNPYGSPDTATESALTSKKNTLGFNKVTDDGTKVTVVTCWDEPCTGTNVMTDTVPIE